MDHMNYCMQQPCRINNQLKKTETATVTALVTVPEATEALPNVPPAAPCSSNADEPNEPKVNFMFLANFREDKKQLLDFAMNLGLIANTYACCKCGKNMKLCAYAKIREGYIWQCSERHHTVKRSIRNGSWFKNSKLGMHEILLIIYMWCQKASNDWIVREVQVSFGTVVEWLKSCREVCVKACTDGNVKLGGSGVVVEIGEMKFGKSSGGGKRAKWVLGGLERGTDKCFMQIVQERSKDSLLRIIKENILEGTTIVSACWKDYEDCLDDEGYVHLKVDRSIAFVNADPGTCTNGLDGTWSALKRSLNMRTTNEFSSYLFEYMWRRRHKKDKGALFVNFLKAVAKAFPPQPYD